MRNRLIAAAAIAAGASLTAMPLAFAEPPGLDLAQALRPLEVTETTEDGQFDVSGFFRGQPVSGTISVGTDQIVGVFWSDGVSATVTIPIAEDVRRNEVRRELRAAVREVARPQRGDGDDDSSGGITTTVGITDTGRAGNPHTIVTATTPSGTVVEVPEHAVEHAPGLRGEGEDDGLPGQRRGHEADEPDDTTDQGGPSTERRNDDSGPRGRSGEHSNQGGVADDHPNRNGVSDDHPGQGKPHNVRPVHQEQASVNRQDGPKPPVQSGSASNKPEQSARPNGDAKPGRGGRG